VACSRGSRVMGFVDSINEPGKKIDKDVRGESFTSHSTNPLAVKGLQLSEDV
jgi:hypothetical protein